MNKDMVWGMYCMYPRVHMICTVQLKYGQWLLLEKRSDLEFLRVLQFSGGGLLKGSTLHYVQETNFC